MQSMAAAVGAGICVLASFRSEAKGVKFYDVLTSEIYIGQSLHCSVRATEPIMIATVLPFICHLPFIGSQLWTSLLDI